MIFSQLDNYITEVENVHKYKNKTFKENIFKSIELLPKLLLLFDSSF